MTAIRALYTNHTFSVEQLLTDNPHLLTFATTNDLLAARTAFVNAVDRYNEASAFIRARPAGLTRLFNLDTNQLSDWCWAFRCHKDA